MSAIHTVTAANARPVHIANVYAAANATIHGTAVDSLDKYGATADMPAAPVPAPQPREHVQKVCVPTGNVYTAPADYVNEPTDVDYEPEMESDQDSDDGTLVGRVIRDGDMELHLTAVLGSGAYGTVYKAIDRKTATLYAVKHLPEAHLTPAQRRLQRAEADLHARCNGHPGILELHRIISHYPGIDGWFMVLEYCPEGDLFEYINDGRMGHRTLESEARRLLEEVIDAVEWCHKRGVYHRDIKPENILMRRGSDGRMHIRLGDFGLATEDAYSTEHGCGSTFYMSPESRSSAAPTPYATRPSDVWSVAVLLVNMTCARNPWRRAERHDATFASFLRDPIGTLTVALPITESFARVLARCFDPNPVRRCTLEELRQIMRACPRLRRDLPPSMDLHIPTPVNIPTPVAPSAYVAAPRPVSTVASAETVTPTMSSVSGMSSPSSISTSTAPSTPVGERCQSPVQQVTVALPGYQPTQVAVQVMEPKVKPSVIAPQPRPRPQTPGVTSKVDCQSVASASSTSIDSGKSKKGKSKRKSCRMAAKKMIAAASGCPGLTAAFRHARHQLWSIFVGGRQNRQ